MTNDDWTYLVVLITSISFGPLVRSISDPGKRQLTCTLLGCILLFVLSSYHALHAVILTFMNAIIILNVSKKICHVMSFIFCFTYLLFIRTSEYYGVPSPPEITNTALMIMVLKMVGLAYEMNLNHIEQTGSTVDSNASKVMSPHPTFVDIIQYSFCYAGLLVGPYFKYSTYFDLFQKPYSKCVPHLFFLRKRIIIIPLYASLYLLSDYLFPLSLASSEAIWQMPFVHRMFYIWPWFFSFRMKMYIAFVLGECICINLGLGAYPKSYAAQSGHGPTVLPENKNEISNTAHYDFETVRCMDEMASEFRPTMREGIRYWNMTVQYWLAIYIYKKTAASKPLKMLATMLVSAIWHGVYPGYYLSLLGTPLLLLSEIEVEKAFRTNTTQLQKKIYDIFWYFVKMQSLSYMGMAFILLDIKVIIHYWSSIYYIGHFFVFFLFIVAFMKVNIWDKRDLKESTKLKSL